MISVTRQATLCMLIVVAVQSALIANDDADGKSTGLTGKWKVIKVQHDGMDVKLSDVSGLNDEVEFKDGLVIGMFSGDKVATTEIDLFPGDPPRFRRRFVGDGKTILVKGIYKIERDNLFWNEVLPQASTPKDFKTTKGDKRTVVMLKRINET